MAMTEFGGTGDKELDKKIMKTQVKYPKDVLNKIEQIRQKRAGIVEKIKNQRAFIVNNKRLPSLKALLEAQKRPGKVVEQPAKTVKAIFIDPNAERSGDYEDNYYVGTIIKAKTWCDAIALGDAYGIEKFVYYGKHGRISSSREVAEHYANIEKQNRVEAAKEEVRQDAADAEAAKRFMQVEQALDNFTEECATEEAEGQQILHAIDATLNQPPQAMWRWK